MALFVVLSSLFSTRNFSRSIRTTRSTRLSSKRNFGLITPTRSSGRDSLDTAIFEFDKDSLITKAELDANMLASSLFSSSGLVVRDADQEAGWAEGFARGPLFQEETPGDQLSRFGMEQVIKSQ